MTHIRYIKIKRKKEKKEKHEIKSFLNIPKNA